MSSKDADHPPPRKRQRLGSRASQQTIPANDVRKNKEEYSSALLNKSRSDRLSCGQHFEMPSLARPSLPTDICACDRDQESVDELRQEAEMAQDADIDSPTTRKRPCTPSYPSTTSGAELLTPNSDTSIPDGRTVQQQIRKPPMAIDLNKEYEQLEATRQDYHSISGERAPRTNWKLGFDGQYGVLQAALEAWWQAHHPGLPKECPLLTQRGRFMLHM